VVEEVQVRGKAQQDLGKPLYQELLMLLNIKEMQEDPEEEEELKVILALVPEVQTEAME
jgi:hypothetical protein